MSEIPKILRRMTRNPMDIRFSELRNICDHYFGEPRLSGGSHYIYKTPWPGNPRVNIQKRGNKAKPYQVRQVLLAIEKLEVENGCGS